MDDTCDVSNWEDAGKLLRKWRDENMRKSVDTLDLWLNYVQSNINKFDDEKWLVYEQVYLSALDCNNMQIANECLKALKDQFPASSIRIRKLSAMRYEVLEKFDEAIKIYNSILEDDEMNAQIRKRRIACLKSQLNKTKEYIQELCDYLKFYQADYEAWLELSDAYLNDLDYSKAAFCLEELILINPHAHVYHQKYADIKYTQGNYELAKTYYSYALKLNENNLRALYGLLMSCTNLKSQVKSKELLADYDRIATWAAEQLKMKYQCVNTQNEPNLDYLFNKNVSLK